MANVRSGNSFYVDTAASSEASSDASNLSLPNVVVTGVLLTATSASARIVLEDVTTGNIKLDLRVATSGDSKFFDLSRTPINFPNGISPATVTNAVATIIGQESRK